MNLDPCTECGAQLAPEQRYCLNCGHRVGPPMAMPYVPATPAQAAEVAAPAYLQVLPMPLQMATMFAALALGLGVVVGTAISPSVSNLLAAPAQIVEEAPTEPPPAASTGGGGGPGGGTAVAGTTSADTGTSFGSTGGDVGGGGGGGGGGKQPKEPKPTYATGTVVHANPVAQSYTVAQQGGLTAIHAASLPAVGIKVRVPVRTLNNRTFAEDGKRKLQGQATEATFGGIVTDLRDSTDPAVPDAYTVSARGASILIRAPKDETPGTTERPPEIGTQVTTTVEIRNATGDPLPAVPPGPVPACAPEPDGALPTPPVVPQKELVQKSVSAGGAAESTEVETVIQRLCQSQAEMLISTDDIRQGKTDVSLGAAAVDMSLLFPGQAVIASVTIVDDLSGPPGAKKLAAITGVAGDTGEVEADDETASQGSLASRTVSPPARRRSERDGG